MMFLSQEQLKLSTDDANIIVSLMESKFKKWYAILLEYQNAFKLFGKEIEKADRFLISGNQGGVITSRPLADNI